jgi:hypothetical protein
LRTEQVTLFGRVQDVLHGTIDQDAQAQALGQGLLTLVVAVVGLGLPQLVNQGGELVQGHGAGSA